MKQLKIITSTGITIVSLLSAGCASDLPYLPAAPPVILENPPPVSQVKEIEPQANTLLFEDAKLENAGSLIPGNTDDLVPSEGILVPMPNSFKRGIRKKSSK